MPLDCTWIHPESYEIAEKIIEKCDLYYKNIGKPEFIINFRNNIQKISSKNLAAELNTKEATVKLIVEVLSRPLNHDLREENSEEPLFRKGVTSMDDMKCGILLTGRVTNVTHFGAFVDIGVGQNGLIHTSAMRGLNPELGQRVEIRIIKIEKQKNRIGLELMKIY